MAYTKQTWQDLPSKTTPINASRLGHIEQGIYDAASTADTAASNASSAISGLADKVDKVEGKGLSTNDFTDALKTKLDNIEAGAEVNVQSDWDQSDNSADDYIKNKPSLGTAAYKNSTSVVTDSSDLVESGAVYDVIGWGNKNLLNNIAVTPPSPVNGVTFTINADKSVTLNNSATANMSFQLYRGKFKAGTYIARKNNLNSQSNRVWLTIYSYAKSANLVSVMDNETEKEFTVDNNDANDILIGIYIFNGASFSSETIYPMITKTGILDATYEPYHASVEETKADNSVIGTVENGTTASQAYAVNDVFIRNGALCKVTSAISQGDTLSNQFTVTNVGAILTALLNA